MYVAEGENSVQLEKDAEKDLEKERKKKADADAAQSSHFDPTEDEEDFPECEMTPCSPPNSPYDGTDAQVGAPASGASGASAFPRPAASVGASRGTIIRGSSLLQIGTRARWTPAWRPGNSTELLETQWKQAHTAKQPAGRFDELLDFVFERDNLAHRRQVVLARGWVKRRSERRSFNGVGYYPFKPSMRELRFMKVSRGQCE